MKEILRKCTAADFEFISGVLDSNFSLTNDKRRKELLNRQMVEPNDLSNRDELVKLIDRQIRYFGSADLAYLKRQILSGEGGVSAIEVVEDVCKKLSIKIKMGGSLESRLEKLVSATVEKEVLAKGPDELAAQFKEMGIGDVKIDLILEALRRDGQVAVLPILVEFLGPKITLQMIETIVIGLIASVIGREAAKHLVKEMIKRNPWLNSLGPVLWAVSAAWLGLDLQGPAFRKTVPVCLYLGIVALRDGVEDPDLSISASAAL